MDILPVLNHVYGFQSLRESQRVIVDTILSGKDTLALLPTGGGKSLCYQLPVLTVGGRALVITPLISLMEDQVARLKQRHIKAVCIHSYLDLREKRLILNELDRYQFIFCSPEWLVTDKAKNFLRQLVITHLVIDEAHCISEWGYDFRPHYLLLNEVVQSYAAAQIIALTATADHKVIRDIERVLNKKLTLIDQVAERENIYFNVLHCEQGQKVVTIQQLLTNGGPTIIYFASKRICDEVHGELAAVGFSGMTYHADMSYEERMNVQASFQADQIQYICATSAFGMGIDKPNIRTIIHFHAPKSLSQYIQESGRAGRDGKEAQAVLLYNQDDINLALRLIREGRLSVIDLDFFVQKVQLPEEKMEQLRTLTRRFSIEEIRQMIVEGEQERISMLRAVEAYGQVNRCLTSQLYDVESCNHCAWCIGQKVFYFENKVKLVEIKPYKDYINSLFHLQ